MTCLWSNLAMHVASWRKSSCSRRILGPRKIEMLLFSVNAEKQARKQLATLICKVKDSKFGVHFTRCCERAATCYCEHLAELKSCVQSSLTCSYLTQLFLSTTSIVVTMCASGQAHFCTEHSFQPDLDS